MIELLLTIVTLFVLGLLGLAFIIPPKAQSAAPSPPSGVWRSLKVDDRQADFVTNDYLQQKQCLRSQGGVLSSDHIVVVWADNFLDHDIFFDTICDNIQSGIGYLYILDRRHADSFDLLIKRLSKFISVEMINSHVDVVFVDPALCMSNHVLYLDGGQGTVEGYTSIIVNRRPILWVSLSEIRVNMVREKVTRLWVETMRAQRLAAETDITQAQHSAPGLFRVSDQISKPNKGLDLESGHLSVRDLVQSLRRTKVAVEERDFEAVHAQVSEPSNVTEFQPARTNESH